MTEPKYFVAKIWNNAYNTWKCRRADGFDSGGTGFESVIWRGNDYREGQRVAAEANRKARPAPLPKVPKEPRRARLHGAELEKLARWKERAK